MWSKELEIQKQNELLPSFEASYTLKTDARYEVETLGVEVARIGEWSIYLRSTGHGGGRGPTSLQSKALLIGICTPCCDQ